MHQVLTLLCSNRMNAVGESFPALIDGDEFKTEWRYFRSQFHKLRNYPMRQAWGMVKTNGLLVAQCPNIMKVCKLQSHLLCIEECLPNRVPVV